MYAKLKLLPPGAVRAKGWIREQLLRNKDGMGGHLDELEPQMLATPYTTREPCERWLPAYRAGWGAELSGNYWYGLILLAFTLDDAELKAKATAWVDEVLTHQEPDGYLGTYQPTDDRWDDFNAWGTNSGMKALMAYYEATGRQDVLDAVYRCMLWFCKNWAGEKKTSYGGIVLLETMAQVYELTRDEALLRFCEDYIAYVDEHDFYENSRRAYLSPRLIYSSEHSAGYMTHMWAYTAAYNANGDRLSLRAVENGMRKLEDKILQKTGGVPCFAEFLAPRSGHAETEYCAYAYFQAEMLKLMETTGKIHYADLMEMVTFNGAQGARKKDEKAIPYMSSPNQLYATKHSSWFTTNLQMYTPCYPTACCPTVSVWIMPTFVRSLAMEGEGALWFGTYGPCDVRWNGMTVTEETDYPFRDTVRFRIAGSGKTTLCFRIPAWCRNAAVSVNGEAVTAPAEDGWLRLEREYRDGDEITLHLPMEVRISQVDDRDAGNQRPIAIEYGPLLMAFHVPEKWKQVPSEGYTPLPEGWAWWNCQATAPKDPRGDTYEQNGLRGHVASWYFAMDEHVRPEDITVELCDGGYVWEEPQIRMRVPVYRAIHAYAPYAKKTMEPFECPLTVYGEPYEIELVPYGCTNLRISYIPRAKLPAEPMPEIKR